MRRVVRRRFLVIAAMVGATVVGIYLPGSLLLRPDPWMHRAARATLPAVLIHVDTDSLAVALTIDDAPSPEVTPGILDVLRRHDVKATFFVIGSYAERYPELMDAIRADGHELANHLYFDEPSIRLDDQEFVYKLRHTDAVIRPEGPIKWFRPGSGWLDDDMIALVHQEGYRICLASIYPLDLYAPRWLAVWQFTANVKPGAILVVHDGGGGRERAVGILDEALARLVAEGVRVVTVSELVGMERAAAR